MYTTRSTALRRCATWTWPRTCSPWRTARRGRQGGLAARVQHVCSQAARRRERSGRLPRRPPRRRAGRSLPRVLRPLLRHFGEAQPDAGSLDPSPPLPSPGGLQALTLLRSLIQRHVKYTNSTVGRAILLDWDAASKSFVKARPHRGGRPGARQAQHRGGAQRLGSAWGLLGACLGPGGQAGGRAPPAVPQSGCRLHWACRSAPAQLRQRAANCPDAQEIQPPAATRLRVPSPELFGPQYRLCRCTRESTAGRLTRLPSLRQRRRQRRSC